MNKKPFNKSHGQSGDTNKRCWQCNSTSHLSFQCTVRPRKGATGAKSLPYNSAGTSKSALPGPTGHQPNRVMHGAGVNSVGAETEVKLAELQDDVRGGMHAQCNKVCLSPSDTSNSSVELAQDESQFKLAQLHYIHVNIVGSDYCWRALHDSGSEVDVIDRHKLIQLCVPHEVVGNIALRPMAGPVIPAQLVKIKMCLAESTGQATSYFNLVVAACDDLHDELILSEPNVQRLIAGSH